MTNRNYDELAEELLRRLDDLKRFTKHSPSIGFHREEILRETLRTMLAERFQVCSGFSFADEENVSSEGDILIIDTTVPAPYPILFQTGGHCVVEPRALLCVIQVKTSLTKASFRNAIENLASFRRVAEKAGQESGPATYVFAYKSRSFELDKLDGWYKSVTTEHALRNYPVCVLSLEHGLLWVDPKLPNRTFGHRLVQSEARIWPRGQGLSMFLSSIHNHMNIRSGYPVRRYEGIKALRRAPDCFRYGTGWVKPRTR